MTTRSKQLAFKFLVFQLSTIATTSYQPIDRKKTPFSANGKSKLRPNKSQSTVPSSRSPASTSLLFSQRSWTYFSWTKSTKNAKRWPFKKFSNYNPKLTKKSAQFPKKSMLSCHYSRPKLLSDPLSLIGYSSSHISLLPFLPLKNVPSKARVQLWKLVSIKRNTKLCSRLASI